MSKPKTSLQTRLRRIRISMVALTSLLVIVFVGMLFYSSSLHMHMLSGYQDLQDYYYAVSEGTDAVKDYLINENSRDLSTYTQAIERARKSLSRLEDNPYLEEKWRFNLLENMLESYEASAEALEDQYRNNLRSSAYQSYYEDFLMQDDLIQETSVSYYHLLTNSMNRMQNYYTGIQTAGLLISGAAVVLMIWWIVSLEKFFRNDLSRPLRVISENIGNIREGQFSLGDRSASSQEMQEVFDALQDMAARVSRSHEVEKENLLLEKKLAQSRLKMLQNQINPHFLFNTLNAIYCLCEDGNSEQAADMIFKTSHLLRYGLEMQTRISTIGQEIDALQDYIEIQNMRKKDWIDFDLQLDENREILRLPMPAMILQPLAENSILHGLKDRTAGAKITVSVMDAQDEIEICLDDNGCGVTPDKLQQLLHAESESAETGLGLFNVLHRMEAFYGPRFEYEIFSEYGRSFTVVLRIRSEETV